LSSGRYQPRDQQIFDLQSDAILILEHQSTVFIGSKAADTRAAADAAAAAAAAAQRAAETQRTLQRNAAAAEKNFRDAKRRIKGKPNIFEAARKYEFQLVTDHLTVEPMLVHARDSK
jgi:type IV secretory pathway VirB9-like protein